MGEARLRRKRASKSFVVGALWGLGFTACALEPVELNVSEGEQSIIDGQLTTQWLSVLDSTSMRSRITVGPRGETVVRLLGRPSLLNNEGSPWIERFYDVDAPTLWDIPTDITVRVSPDGEPRCQLPTGAHPLGINDDSEVLTVCSEDASSTTLCMYTSECEERWRVHVQVDSGTLTLGDTARASAGGFGMVFRNVSGHLRAYGTASKAFAAASTTSVDQAVALVIDDDGQIRWTMGLGPVHSKPKIAFGPKGALIVASKKLHEIVLGSRASITTNYQVPRPTLLRLDRDTGEIIDGAFVGHGVAEHSFIFVDSQGRLLLAHEGPLSSVDIYDLAFNFQRRVTLHDSGCWIRGFNVVDDEILLAVNVMDEVNCVLAGNDLGLRHGSTIVGLLPSDKARIHHEFETPVQSRPREIGNLVVNNGHVAFNNEIRDYNGGGGRAWFGVLH